jgi:hypothetical protein
MAIQGRLVIYSTLHLHTQDIKQQAWAQTSHNQDQSFGSWQPTHIESNREDLLE